VGAQERQDGGLLAVQVRVEQLVQLLQRGGPLAQRARLVRDRQQQRVQPAVVGLQLVQLRHAGGNALPQQRPDPLVLDGVVPVEEGHDQGDLLLRQAGAHGVERGRARLRRAAGTPASCGVGQQEAFQVGLFRGECRHVAPLRVVGCDQAGRRACSGLTALAPSGAQPPPPPDPPHEGLHDEREAEQQVLQRRETIRPSPSSVGGLAGARRAAVIASPS
jgi:hypothetical protein